MPTDFFTEKPIGPTDQGVSFMQFARWPVPDFRFFARKRPPPTHALADAMEDGRPGRAPVVEAGNGPSVGGGRRLIFSYHNFEVTVGQRQTFKQRRPAEQPLEPRKFPG